VADVKAAADRPVFLPCRLRAGGAVLEAEPLPWTGSSDLLGLAAGAAFRGASPGLIALAAGAGRIEAGREVEVVRRG
jgi:molybdopterin biosynthesis enzyme